MTAVDPLVIEFSSSPLTIEFASTGLVLTVASGTVGPAGPQGSPGEVSAGDLSFAIGGTPSNCNGVQLLGLTVSDPPTQSELQAVVNKIDELIQALRR